MTINRFPVVLVFSLLMNVGLTKAYVKETEPHISMDNSDPPVPVMIGLRIENPEDMVPNKDEMIPRVHPDVDIFITMFGNNMDQVAAVLFSPRPDCDEMPWMDPIEKFQQQLPSVVTVKTRFPSPDVDELYYVCLLTKKTLRQFEEIHNLDPEDASKFKNMSKFFRPTDAPLRERTEQEKAEDASDEDDPPSSLFLFQGSENHAIFIVTELEDEIEMPIYLQVFLIIGLLLFSGLFSGLNLGLMSLDETELKIFMNSGTAKERRDATRIYPVRKTGNYLLCTILFVHVFVNSAISILFDDMTSGLIALFASSLGIVIIGEIIPQSVCSRHGLAIGSRAIWLIKIFMVITAPLSWPTSKILDRLLGKDVGTVYNRERLLELIRLSKDLQKELKDCHEVAIVTGALELGSKQVGNYMTPLRDAFMLPSDTTLDTKTVSMIVRRGFTRVPVFEGSRENVVMLLNTKDLILYNPADCIPLKTVCQFFQHQVRIVSEDTNLSTMLNEFQQGDYHIAFVERGSKASKIGFGHPDGSKYREIVGLITLEDVLEQILQHKIMDEKDVVSGKDGRMVPIKYAHSLGDLSIFINDDDTEQHMVSPQLAIAAYQFLSTSMPAFSPSNVNEKVLQCLIKQHIYKAKAPEKGADPKYLYTKGKHADYFILILEGRVEVISGVDNMNLEAGPFFSFGKKLITDLCAQASPSTLLRQPKQISFIPDYTVSVSRDLIYFQLKTAHYLNALNATIIESKPSAIPANPAVTVYQLLENALNLAANIPTGLGLNSEGQGPDGAIGTTMGDRRKNSVGNRSVGSGGGAEKTFSVVNEVHSSSTDPLILSSANQIAQQIRKTKPSDQSGKSSNA